MTNQDHITEMERQLAEAKRAASPVIIEKTEETKDKIVYVNRTSGTVRTDLRGGTASQFVEPVSVKPEAEVPFLQRPVDKAVGKVIKVSEDQRVIKLAGSGTLRTDVR